MIAKLSGFILLFLYSLFQAQDLYSGLRKKYWEYEENDEKALPIINLAISIAKKEKNFSELYQSYDDAIRFSPNEKLKYADSAITAAKLSNNTDLIGSSYINKGVVFYFNYRKFQPALDEYLIAYEYTKNAKDQFLKFENLYHIGVVKSYLGYYQEALPIFQECLGYFQPNTIADIHPNLIINNQKGYLNTLHQMIVCYQALGKYKDAQKLMDEGIAAIPKNKFFYLESAYFQKAKGILDFHYKKYDAAINHFDNSLPELIKMDDFTWISVAYFYKGQSYQKLGKEELALDNYKKVDSIFNKHHFILPELRKNYEALISYYRKQNDPKQELYYTKQLMKADALISDDFKYLSSRIHKDYDTKTLLEAKADLEHRNTYGTYVLAAFAIFIVILGYFLYKRSNSNQEIHKRYKELVEEISKPIVPEFKEVEVGTIDNISRLDPAIVKRLTLKLALFEKNNGFLEKGITAGKLAAQFETNTSYLSRFINETTGSNFNAFINQLRIKYATQKIYESKEWRKYSVEDIADACGFSNRQSFSKIFFEQNGVRPQYFLKKRNEEAELQKVS